MKLNHLLSVGLISLSLAACNEQPKAETPVVVEQPVAKADTVIVVEHPKAIVEQTQAETKLVVKEEKVEVQAEKETQISVGSKGASLKTKNVDIQLGE